MTLMSTYWLNQHVVALIQQRANTGRNLNLPFKNATTFPVVQPAGLRTGVYFDNCEVSQNIHPTQVRYSNRFVSAVPSLPMGKPMPQPPRLLNSKAGMASTNEDKPVRSETPNSLTTTDCKRKAVCSGYKERPSKRCRVETDPKPDSLSNEQIDFVEAALALAESTKSSSSANNKSTLKLTPTTSPKSVLQALPPPPFFLAGNHHFDLKESVKSARSA